MTTASGNSSHAEGLSDRKISSVITDFSSSTSNDDIISAWTNKKFSLAKGNYSHSEGHDTLSLGDNSHAEGYMTTASGNSSHAEGQGTASGDYSHAEGRMTIASGVNSHTEGAYTTASGVNSHAEGAGTTAIGIQSHAEGNTAIASGSYSHAEGLITTASGNGSHTEGQNTTSSGDYSHAEGSSDNTISSVITDFSSSTSNDDIISAWTNKKFSLAKGEASHIEGKSNLALEYYSHAEGYNTVADGYASHAEGLQTKASNFASHATGKFNAAMTTGGAEANTTGTAFVIGNGTSTSALSNAFSVQYNGTVKAKSTITASTTADYAEFFEWLDKNPDNEDRVGYFVTLDGDKIRVATNEDDYILGVVSGEPFVLGNGDCDTWNGMFLRDEFRRTIYEPAPKMIEVDITEEREEKYTDEETGEEKTRTVKVVVGTELKEVEGEFEGTRPKLNPEYDNTQTYISRFERKEWSPIGMLGVLAVRHDGTAQVNGYVTVNADGIATACEKSAENAYRVIKSNTDSVVEIIFK